MTHVSVSGPRGHLAPPDMVAPTTEGNLSNLFSDIYIQGRFFLLVRPKQVSDYKCQNFLRVWHLVIFGADQ